MRIGNVVIYKNNYHDDGLVCNEMHLRPPRSFMHSLLPDYLAKLRFDAQQLATLRALGEYRGKQQLYVAQPIRPLHDSDKAFKLVFDDALGLAEGYR